MKRDGSDSLLLNDDQRAERICVAQRLWPTSSHQDALLPAPPRPSPSAPPHPRGGAGGGGWGGAPPWPEPEVLPHARTQCVEHRPGTYAFESLRPFNAANRRPFSYLPVRRPSSLPLRWK